MRAIDANGMDVNRKRDREKILIVLLYGSIHISLVDMSFSSLGDL